MVETFVVSGASVAFELSDGHVCFAVVVLFQVLCDRG